MTTKSFALGTVAVLSATVLSAESLVQFGENGQISASLSVGARADDNIFLRETNEESDMIFTVYPQIEINYGTKIGELQLILSEQFLRYADNTDANNELADLSFSHEFKGQKTQVKTSASYREFSQGSVNVFNQSQTLDREQLAFSENVERSFTAKTSGAVGFSYAKTSYADSQYADYKEYSVPVRVYYSIRPKLDLSAGYRIRKSKSEPAVGITEKYTDQYLNVGVRGVLTPKTSVTADVGLNHRKKDSSLIGGDKSENQLGITLNANHTLTPKIELDFGISRDFAIALDGNSQKQTVFSARAKGSFTQRFSTELQISFENGDWESGRTDDFWVIENSYVYLLTKKIQLQFGYNGRFNNSDDPTDLLNPTKQSFDNNVLFANVAYSF